MSLAFLSLGSNLGDRQKFLTDAAELINKNAGKILSFSSIYQTQPWGKFYNNPEPLTPNLSADRQDSELRTPNPELLSPNSFLNQVLKIQTTLSPHELLDKLNDIEKNLGRAGEKRIPNNDQRTTINDQRTPNSELRTYNDRPIDIDILFYDDIILNDDNLTIPHPLLQDRKFVLIPLSEIAANMQHPVLKLSIGALLSICPDESNVRKV